MLAAREEKQKNAFASFSLESRYCDVVPKSQKSPLQPAEKPMGKGGGKASENKRRNGGKQGRTQRCERKWQLLITFLKNGVLEA